MAPTGRHGPSRKYAGQVTIGVDVGGTKIAGGVVDEKGQVHQHVRVETENTSTDAIVDGIVEVVEQLHEAEGERAAAVGIAAAGYVDAARSTVLFAPNLVWRNTPLRDLVSQRAGLPVIVENDANAAAWGEFVFGAGQGVDDMLMLTVGTGLGGGIVTDGDLYRGSFGIGAEVGHMRVVVDGHRCGCGNRGCWEVYASGRALVREARALAESGSPRAGAILELAGGKPAEIDGAMITEAARQNDSAAIELLEELGRWLGEGIASVTAILDPGRVVVGGGVAEAGDLLLSPARDAFARQLTGRGYRPVLTIVRAELENAGIVGAADLARVD
jgi:glucokinase